MKNLVLGFFACLLFLIIGVLTLDHYGVSWDEPEHFDRGQAYFWLFLTGDKTYRELAPYDLPKARTDPNYHERSLYQIDAFNAQARLQNDGHHPPLNDILAASFNYVFYQKTGLLGDIESYHLFNVVVSAVLVGVVFLFAAETFGIWAGIFAALFMATYPLFWAESHFNIKDPAETTFFTFTLYLFWRGIHYQKVKFILFSALSAGLALSVKFNILFAPFIIGPWLLLVMFTQKPVLRFVLSKKVLLTFFLFPFIMLGILVAVWPFLWANVYTNTVAVFRYYQDIGTEQQIPINQIGIRLYALRWIIFSTPPVLIGAFVIGLIFIVRSFKKYSYVQLLWVLFCLISILRVSVSYATIYGGVRQIMEYIPGLALIAGVGVYITVDKLNIYLHRIIGNKSWLIFTSALLIIAGVSIYPLYRLHPHENVYFNFLIGGLPGAVEKKMPSAGNSFGNAYKQGVDWLNAHAEPGARLALVQGTIRNVPDKVLRSDIQYSNSYWSGIDRKGEYLMELTYNQEFTAYYYAWEYVNKMLEPVYEVKADGVPILKIWKNDLEHTRERYRRPEIKYTQEIRINKLGDVLIASFPNRVTLSRIYSSSLQKSGCLINKSGEIKTSVDGMDWQSERDPIALPQLETNKELPKGDFVYVFAAREAKFISIPLKDDKPSCNATNVSIDAISL